MRVTPEPGGPTQYSDENRGSVVRFERSTPLNGGWARRAFAVSAAVLMVLVAFTALSSRAASEPVEVAPAPANSGGTTYGPGIAVTPLSDNATRVQYVPTFHRWDGAWRPMSALNRSAGEWPYRVDETPSEIRVTRLGKMFVQAKLPGALYEFLPDGIKETIVIPLNPSDSLISIPFSGTYAVDVRGDEVTLRDDTGMFAWTTQAFHAWDSAESPRTWDRPVTYVAYVNGQLRIALDPAILANAVYPLYVDPTWKTNASMGWPSISKTDIAEDLGDHNLRIGWFADNFNDGTKDSVWATDMGSWWLSGGQAQLNTSTRIRATTSSWDTKFQAKITITATGSGVQNAYMLFRWKDTQNYYFLEIVDSTDIVRLARMIGGSATTLCQAPRPLAKDVPYVVKVDAQGNSFTVFWDGAVHCTATDPSPPAPWSPAHLGLSTTGTKMKIATDDARAWTADFGYVTTNVRSATPGRMRSVHTVSAYTAVDLRILSSSDNASWGDPHYVKAGAKSKSSDSSAYQIQDADRKTWYRARVDLRTTDDNSPALAEIAVVEGTFSLSSTPLLGYEPWQYYVGGIVEAEDGNLVLGSSDLTLPGKGWSLSFTRTYNSRGAITGTLGNQWTHSYHAFLSISATHANFTDGDGSTHAFEDMGGGLYSSPLGLSGTKLVKNGDGTFSMAWKDGSRWAFSSAGKLTQMTDRNGNKVTLTYDGSGRLTKVADDSGIFLLLSYDASGRINRVGDHNVTILWRNFTTYYGSWANMFNADSSNNLYANTNFNGHLATFYGYGFTGPSSAWITKVEACVEAHTAGDDDLGVKISTNSGSTWSTEQIVNLPSSDPNTLTCLDFSSHLPSWSWSDLGSNNFQVQVRYVQVGGGASQEYLDWIPARVTTANRFVSYAYDPAGLLANVTDALGKSELYMYYAGTNLMKWHVDRADKLLEFVYNGMSVWEVWTGQYNRPSGTIAWEFNQYTIDRSQPYKTIVYDALNYETLANKTTIWRDSIGAHPISIDGPLAASGMGCSCCGSSGSEKWTIEWDGERNWISKADGKGQTTRVAYDWRGNVVRQTDALGNYTENTWQNRDNSTVFDSLAMTQRNKRGFTTTNEHDWKGNLVKTTDALGNFTRMFYTPAGFVNKTTDKRGFNTTYTYDSHGWRLNTTDPLGHTFRLEYDAVGRPIKTTTALNFVSRGTYNANDWTVSETNPLNFVTRYEYNDRGDRTAAIDANGNRTTFVINVTWGRARKIIESTNDATENSFDKLGRLVQVKDPNARLWKYDYDKFGRRTNETDPLNQKTRHSYDAAGNVVQRIDGNGKYTNYTLYDALNRLKTVSYQDGNALTYSYDANSNVISETGYGFTRTTEYDALDRVKKVTFNFGSFSKIVQYTYDQNSNRKTMVYPDGFTVTYVWDADNRLSNIQITGQTWTFIYDQDHRRTATRHPTGLELNMTYDAANRLTAIRTKDLSTGGTVEGFTYTYDKLANRKTQGNEVNSTSMSFSYYDDYSLNATTNETGAKYYYSYDPNDNRMYKNQTGGLQTRYFRSADSSFSGYEVTLGGLLQRNVTYAYDSNGNLLTKVDTPSGGAATSNTYAYDLENRLTRVTVNSVERTSYAYFPDGTRIRRTEDGIVTHFLYDFRDFNGYNDILEEYDSVGTVKARYVHGPGIDEPLAQQYAGAWHYYHFDGLGSVTRLTDTSKVTKNSYVYDDFGGLRFKSEAIPNSYGFTGHEEDFASYFYRARYYDAGIGRFLTRDPSGMANGPNIYLYVGNNPASWTDPSGLWRRPIQRSGGGNEKSNGDFSVYVYDTVYVRDNQGTFWTCVRWDVGCSVDAIVREYGTLFFLGLLCIAPPTFLVGCPLLITYLVVLLLTECLIDPPGTPPGGGICDCCKLWIRS